MITKNFFRKSMLVIFLICLTISSKLFAQAPDMFSYQAVVRNSDNQLVTNQQVGMQISILQGSADGTSVYAETQTPTANVNGLISIGIGNGTVVSGDLSVIDWSNGPYFIKTETDPEGGTNYSITGTSQVLSVPYALYAKTANNVTGSLNETDPIFNSSVAHGITQADTASWNNKNTFSGKYNDLTGKPDIRDSIDTYNFSGDYNDLTNKPDLSDTSNYLTSESDPDFSKSVAKGITQSDTMNWNGKLDSFTENDPSVPQGTQTGEMQYWDGAEWITVTPGNEGQVLTFVSGVPTWKAQLGIGDVGNPATGKIWMDRNLGASQVATSSTDANAYGDLYQWGRAADGHESRTSSTTSTLSSSDTPGHGDFITINSSPNDWRSPQNDDLWQGVNGTNNPCPAGYRLPTEAEWEAERQSWSSNDLTGAFASPLRLTVAGTRYYTSGTLLNVDSYGNYWSSTVNGTSSRFLSFSSVTASMFDNYRAAGLSVRCFKD